MRAMVTVVARFINVRTTFRTSMQSDERKTGSLLKFLVHTMKFFWQIFQSGVLGKQLYDVQQRFVRAVDFRLQTAKVRTETCGIGGILLCPLCVRLPKQKKRNVSTPG